MRTASQILADSAVIARFLEQTPLFEGFDFALAMRDPHHASLLATPLALLGQTTVATSSEALEPTTAGLREFTLGIENPFLDANTPADGPLRAHTVAMTPDDGVFSPTPHPVTDSFVLGDVLSRGGVDVHAAHGILGHPRLLRALTGEEERNSHGRVGSGPRGARGRSGPPYPPDGGSDGDGDHEPSSPLAPERLGLGRFAGLHRGDAEQPEATLVVGLFGDGALDEGEVFTWPESLDLPGYRPVTKPHSKQIRETARLMVDARRPVLYVGGGVLAGPRGLIASCSVAPKRDDAPGERRGVLPAGGRPAG